MDLFLLAIAIGCVAASFFAGRLLERKRWNDLIEEGILPRPSGARRKR